MKKRLLVALASSTLLLSGCANLNNQDVGALTGGVLGGVLGSQIGGGTGRIAATIGGTLLGAYLGGAVGKSMDRTDKMYMNNALENTPTDRDYRWTNPDTHNTYRVKPTKTYYRKTSHNRSQPCRKFITTAMIDGKAEKMTGTACRQANGAWKIIG